MDTIHGYGRAEDWDDMFGSRVEELDATGEAPPEDWVERNGPPTEGARVVMTDSVHAVEDESTFESTSS